MQIIQALANEKKALSEWKKGGEGIWRFSAYLSRRKTEEEGMYHMS